MNYHSIFDMLFSGSSGIEQYRGWVADDEDTPPARLENWHPEDLITYVGGAYAVTAYTR